MKFIRQQPWHELGEVFRNAEPFPSICIDNFLDDDFAIELANSYPDFNTAGKSGYEFNTVNEKRKIQITDPSTFPDKVRDLQSDLSSSEFLNAMETLSGIKGLVFDENYDGGGMHLTSQSGILDVHVDFNKSNKLELYRRLNILIYLNSEWNSEWGGEIELWNRDVTRCVQRFTPRLGRCLIFATSDISFHGVAAVNCPAGISRNSFAIYLYNRESASGSNEVEHGTIFKARPSEPYKKYIAMPLEVGSNLVARKIHAAKRKIKKVVGR